MVIILGLRYHSYGILPQPAEFMETLFPILVEKLGLRMVFGDTGLFRGAPSYEIVVPWLIRRKFQIPMA